MSKFMTAISVDLGSTLEILPRGAAVSPPRLNANKGRIEIEWEHDRYYTGLSVPIDFSSSLLTAGGVPQGVTDRNPPAEAGVVQDSAPEPEALAEETPKRGRPRKT